MPFRTRARQIMQVRHADPAVRRRGASVIALALILLAASAPLCVLGLVDPGWRAVALVIAPLLAGWVGIIWLARAGRVTLAALLLIAATVGALVLAPVLSARVAFTPFFFLIPVVIGIASVRPGQLWIVSGMALAGIAALALATSHIPPSLPTNASLYGLSASLILLISGVGMAGMRVMDRALAGAAAAQREAEQLARALASEKAALSARVEERTAELSAALAEARQLAARQASLLEENAAQRAQLRQLSTPALPLDQGIVVMPLIGDLGPARLADIQQQALAVIAANAAHHLLLDVTGVPALDRTGADSLFATIDAARLLGCAVALVGVGPAMAESLASIAGVRRRLQCFSTLQSALRSLRTPAAARAG